MQIIGYLIIVAIFLWLFVVTLPFLWWLWVLGVGSLLVVLGQWKKEDKERTKLVGQPKKDSDEKTENN